MTRKEQIIEILDKYGLIDENYLEVANAILALPTEVPSDEEIDKKAYYYSQLPVSDEEGCETEFDGELSNAFAEGVEWAINEIIERNK